MILECLMHSECSLNSSIALLALLLLYYHNDLMFIQPEHSDSVCGWQHN